MRVQAIKDHEHDGRKLKAGEVYELDASPAQIRRLLADGVIKPRPLRDKPEETK
jgi:hypothetical protein